MSNRKIYRKIAKENGVTLAALKKDMKSAIEYGYKNPSSSVVKSYQQKVSRKGAVPTPDEFIQYAIKEIKNK